MTNKTENAILKFFKSLCDWLKFGAKGLRNIIVPHTLLYRFILIILIPILFLQAVVLIFFLDRHWDTVGHRLAKDVSGEIGTVVTLFQNPDISPEQAGQVIRSLNNQLGLNLFFESGAKIDSARPLIQDTGPMHALTEELKTLGYPFTIHETPDQKAKIAIGLDGGVLHALISKKRFFSSTVYVFMAGLFGFSFLLFLIAFLFMKNQVRSIEKLSQVAELFGQGQSVAHFRPTGATEVRQAGLSFIKMRNRIQRYLSERTGMLSAVSHDLRTPLTRMKLQLSFLEQTEGVEDLQKDILEMEHMIEAYLSFARGEGKEQTETISLNQLLSEIVTKLTRSGQRLDFHQECDVSCACRPNELTRAVTNILTNAARYATKAHMVLGTYRNQARLIIDDNGPGIPPEKRNEVFKAFCRLEKSRNTHTGGIGLGLTITRDIILAHGGEIKLSDSPMGGLRVVILLPLSMS